MKSIRIGMVLSSIVVLGFIVTACDANDPQSAKDTSSVKAEAVQDAAPAGEASAWLAEFFGDKLLTADGSEVATKDLSGKTIGIYFSAHWCPPCQQFTPVLVKTYNELVSAGKPFDLVFVSSDQSEEKMFGYMTEVKMPWKALPFSSDKKGVLGNKYGIRGIPTLVIIDKDGKTITKNGRGEVASKGAAALDGWK